MAESGRDRATVRPRGERYSERRLLSVLTQQEYFSAHGPDALLIAHEVYKTTNVIKYLGQRGNTKGLPSVTLRNNLTKNFLRECLTTKQMRVEIYEPEEGAAGRKNHARWILAKTASPGNISQVESLLFADSDMVSNAVSMAIKVSMKEGQRTVGCAIVDVQEKVIRVSEFVEDENFGNTEVSRRRPAFHQRKLICSLFSSSLE